MIDHLLLVVAVCALAFAGLRVAAAAGAGGILRAIGAAVCAAAAAVTQALALGLAGLADEPLALTGAALATAGVVAAALPAPAAIGFRAWWQAADMWMRCAVCALSAVGLGLAAWQLVHPQVGVDGFTYHLPLAAEWAQSGHPGERFELFAGLPVASYPLTNEVALGWAFAISRSYVAGSLWTLGLYALWLVAVWALLAELGVGMRARVLALAALGTLPIATVQLGGPFTDVPCVAWLAACAALCAGARRAPALLALALVAAALSFGTKTTGAVLALGALCWAIWNVRGSLRRLALPLTAAAAAGVVVGGLWSLRNLIDHGSPLWPFVASSAGDPVPPVLAAIDDSFLSHPRRMLSGRADDYFSTLAGGVVLLAAPLLVPLARRDRAALALALAAALSVLVWGVAPYTGIDDTALAVGATRYLLPALSACAVALALASDRVRVTSAAAAPTRFRRVASMGAALTLGLAAFLSLAKTLTLGFPYLPATATLLALALAGAAAPWLFHRARAIVGGNSAIIADFPPTIRRVGAAVAAVAVAAVLSAAGDGYIDRHTDAGLPDAALLRAAIAEPGFGGGNFPIAMGPATVGLLRGDRLAHRVRFLDRSTSCAAVRQALDSGWVVVQKAPPTAHAAHLIGCLRGAPAAFSDDTYALWTRR